MTERVGSSGSVAQNSAAPPPGAWDDLAGALAAGAFAARRLPETKQMWKCCGFARIPPPLTDTKCLQSGGGKRSSRHLRRRVTSYEPYAHKRHRYPKGKKLVVANDDEYQSKLGRKAVKNDARVYRKRLRAKPDTLCALHDTWRQHPHAEREPSNGSNTIHWLPTHLWHAKRFHMETIFDWRVPMVHMNRGASAAVRLLQRNGKVLLQDMTWRSQPLVVKCLASTFSRAACLIRRIVPNFSIKEADEVNGRGIQTWGHSMLHESDTFPLHAIAPLDWMVCNGTIFDDTSLSVDNIFICVHFFVHPSARQTAHALILQIRDGHEDAFDLETFDGGVSALRLYSKLSENIVKCVNNGLAGLLCRSEGASQSSSVGGTTRLQIVLHGKQKDVVLRARHDPDSNNRVIKQFDLFCCPDAAKRIWIQLVKFGGACPIGVVEEARLCLEQHPMPSPFFPRDFPDTQMGTIYWKKDDVSNDWSTVRRYLEGALSGRTAAALSWSAVSRCDEMSSQSAVAVVRGDLVEPFAACLQQSCRPTSSASATNKLQRRPRRGTRDPTQFRKAPLLNQSGVESLNRTCKLLTDSLSISALLLCYVRVTGKGKFSAGDAVCMCVCLGNEVHESREAALMGYCTTGYFSPSCGFFHGLAVVSAAQFLRGVSLAPRGGLVVTTPANSGAPPIWLEVEIGNDAIATAAALQLVHSTQ